MTMASSKDKVKRNNIVMGNLKLHRATAVCFIVTLLLLQQICTATSYQDAVIVFEKSCSVADVPNSKFYPDAGDAVTSSFYRILEFHDNRGNKSHMFVGGKNSLTELSLNDLSVVRKIAVPVYHTDFECEKIQDSEYYCQNYVTFLQEIDATTSILCGTNYLTPRCVMFQPATQEDTLTGDHDWRAVGISASGPDQNTMTYIKEDGDNMIMYSGAPTQIQYNYAFSRTVMAPDYSSTVVVRTDTSVSTWIESSTSLDPSFIGQPIEYNGKIYFFFREEAVEARNVAKVVYSRVGQVCANDAGGTEDGEGKFTTFLKARLSCATAGDFQLSFDYLHGIFRSPQHPNIIFGAFTTPESAFAASAICAYDLAEIEAVFTTSAFKGQNTGSSLWLNVPNNDVPQDPRPGECSAPQPISSYTKFQLMSKQIPNKADYTSPPRRVPVASPPLILLQLYRFQKLVIQETAVSGLEYDIFFLGTSEGQILKAYIYDETPRIVEKILLDLDSDDAEAINVLKISEDGSRIFASTTSRVYSVPTENCGRFTTCDECVKGLDPACSWEAAQGMQGCVASQDGIMDLANGSISACPVASSTPTVQTSPATPATETTDQTPFLTGTTTGNDGQTPNSSLQTGTSNSTESMGTISPPPPPNMTNTATTPSRLTLRTTPPLPQPQPTTEYNPFNFTPVTPHIGQQLVCECEEGPKMELSICFPWILSSVLIVCCCNIPACIALFLSCKKRKKNYTPSKMNRNRDASQKVPLRSMERLNSDVDEEADELSPMTDTDNGSPHRSNNENSLHEKKNGQSVPMRIPSTGTPVRGTTVSASEA